MSLLLDVDTASTKSVTHSEGPEGSESPHESPLRSRSRSPKLRLSLLADEEIPANAAQQGPACALTSFSWANQFLESMRTRGTMMLGEDVADHLRKMLQREVWISTDYSGIGGPEQAFSEICSASARMFQCSGFDKVCCIRAGDCKEHCRKVLMTNAAGCIFGSILDRCPRTVINRVRSFQLKFSADAVDLKNAGVSHSEAYRIAGRSFLETVACLSKSLCYSRTYIFFNFLSIPK